MRSGRTIGRVIVALLSFPLVAWSQESPSGLALIPSPEELAIAPATPSISPPGATLATAMAPRAPATHRDGETGETSANPSSEARKLEDDDSPSPPRRSRRFSLFDVSDLAPPEALDDQPRAVREAKSADWSIFDRRLRLTQIPGYSTAHNLPLFYIPPVRETKVKRFARRLLLHKLHRETRRLIKKNWGKIFAATPSMSYDEYREMLSRIRRIGRGPTEVDLFGRRHLSAEMRQDMLWRSRWDRDEIKLLRLGPLAVTDSGSLRIDFGRVLTALGLKEEEKKDRGSRLPADDDVDGAEDDHEPVLASRRYRVKTAVRLHVDPIDAIRHDPTWIIDRYGVAVEIRWFSAVLGREVMRTELEVEYRRDGEFAAFINFVIRSRS